MSWSKDSRAIAEAFADWLPRVIQECDPFISTETEKGDAWFQTISESLTESRVGVLFITPRNRNEPWLNYEAGALRTLPSVKRLYSVFIGMKTADYIGPMKGFQLTDFSDPEDMRKMVLSINGQCDRPLDTSMLNDEFDGKWPKLVDVTESAVRAAAAASTDQESAIEGDSTAKRDAEDKFDEILDLLRQQSSYFTSMGASARRLVKSNDTPRTVPLNDEAARDLDRETEAAVITGQLNGQFAYLDETLLGPVHRVLWSPRTKKFNVLVRRQEDDKTYIGYDLNEVNFKRNPL